MTKPKQKTKTVRLQGGRKMVVSLPGGRILRAPDVDINKAIEDGIVVMVCHKFRSEFFLAELRQDLVAQAESGVVLVENLRR